MTIDDLTNAIYDLTPAEWRAVLMAAAEHRCIACGEDSACECPDRVDAAKELVTQRAAQ